MSEEKIVKKVCEMLGVKYSHYDNHDMGMDYFAPNEITSKPKIVVYSSQFGHWEFAILEDMSIFTPTTKFGQIIDSLIKDKAELVEKFDPKTKESVINSHNLYLTEKEVSKFLIENNCSKVINNPKKKINWV